MRRDEEGFVELKSDWSLGDMGTEDAGGFTNDVGERTSFALARVDLLFFLSSREEIPRQVDPEG
jgi:hypothetical protein